MAFGQFSKIQLHMMYHIYSLAEVSCLLKTCPAATTSARVNFASPMNHALRDHQDAFYHQHHKLHSEILYFFKVIIKNEGLSKLNNTLTKFLNILAS